MWNTPPGRRGLGKVGRVAGLASPDSNSRRHPRAFQNIYGCVHGGVRRLALIPAVNPYLPIAFAYRQGIPNPYSLRAHHTRLLVFDGWAISLSLNFQIR